MLLALSQSKSCHPFLCIAWCRGVHRRGGDGSLGQRKDQASENGVFPESLWGADRTKHAHVAAMGSNGETESAPFPNQQPTVLHPRTVFRVHGQYSPITRTDPGLHESLKPGTKARSC